MSADVLDDLDQLVEAVAVVAGEGGRVSLYVRESVSLGAELDRLPQWCVTLFRYIATKMGGVL